MKLNLEQHPCFNDKVRHKFGRIHLPVAPRCNIQCNFCSRKFDCVNESRPGVTSSVLSPFQAINYLKEIMSVKGNISVAGIAGPGDPFANPEETLETLRLIRNEYPEMLLCVASNGLQVLPYVDELKELDVSHVTITLNAVDPEIGEKIYSWVRYGKRVFSPAEGARILLENQLASIKKLKAAGITVKINSIIIPGINDHHIPVIAERVAAMGADILNAIPLYQNSESVFSHIAEPDAEIIKKVRTESAVFMPQMHHCTRCRADAVGLLDEKMTDESMEKIAHYSKMQPAAQSSELPESDRKLIAVASREGLLINQHLGEAHEFSVYSMGPDGPVLEVKRPAPPAGDGTARWEKLAGLLCDCRALLVSGAGPSPTAVLENSGIRVFVMEGLINDAVSAVFEGRNTGHLIKRKETVCGAECSGSGAGCG